MDNEPTLTGDDPFEGLRKDGRGINEAYSLRDTRKGVREDAKEVALNSAILAASIASAGAGAAGAGAAGAAGAATAGAASAGATAGAGTAAAGTAAGASAAGTTGAAAGTAGAAEIAGATAAAEASGAAGAGAATNAAAAAAPSSVEAAAVQAAGGLPESAIEGSLDELYKTGAEGAKDHLSSTSDSLANAAKETPTGQKPNVDPNKGPTDVKPGQQPKSSGPSSPQNDNKAFQERIKKKVQEEGKAKLQEGGLEDKVSKGKDRATLNKETAKAKNQAGREDKAKDDRGRAEKASDKFQEKTGFDAKEDIGNALGEVPIMGGVLKGIVNPLINIGVRVDRLTTRTVKNLAVAIPSILVLVLLAIAAAAGGGVTSSDKAFKNKPDDESPCAPISGGEPGYDSETSNGGSSVGQSQLQNIRTIIGISKGMLPDAPESLQKRAASIAISTAIVESSLVNIGYGDWETGGWTNPDGSATSSLGLFQQQKWWGSAEQRMNPQWSAAKFLSTLFTKNWKTGSRGVHAQSVQASAFPLKYEKEMTAADLHIAVNWALAPLIVPPADLTPDPGTGGSEGGDFDPCSAGGGGAGVSSDKQALAAELIASPNIRLASDVHRSIKGIAEGNEVCAVDLGILQLMKIAEQEFAPVQVSSLNRFCVGQLTGSGITSGHYFNGGGRAVDFSVMRGRAITGADRTSIDYLGRVAPLLPPGSGIGQSNCRGYGFNFPGVANFYDSCNHVHINLSIKDASGWNQSLKGAGSAIGKADE